MTNKATRETVAVVERGTIRLVDSTEVASLDARLATTADLGERRDLPRSHPLYGSKALRNVPAGMPDCTLDDRGRLIPLDLATGKPYVEATAVEPVADGGALERG